MPNSLPVAGALLVAGTLGMDDALAGGHPVDRARPDRLLEAQAVAMHDLA